MCKRLTDDIFWLHGDSSREDFTATEAEQFIHDLPHCKAPISSRTLLVFSNFESVHRVLRMIYPNGDINVPGELASRNFLLFYS